MNDQSTVTKRDLIEGNIGKVFQGGTSVAISETSGGLAFRTMDEVIAGSKMMSMAGPAIPPWLQGNPGGCWAVILQANMWGFDPVSVARMSYEVNGQIAYMSQLVHALIEKRAPLQKRLRFEFEGEGQERQVIVTGHIRGEVDPLEYISPPISRITPKKSPLWQSDPDQQLCYYGSRSWCRRFCPDVLLSVYDREEVNESAIGASNARDVTASQALHERLAAAASQGESREGFHESVVDRGIEETAEDATVVSDGGYVEAQEPASEPERPKGRRGSAKVTKRTSGARKVKDEPAVAKHPEPVEAEPPPPRKTPPLPRDVDGYASYVTEWLALYATEEDVEARWRSELRLRNSCGITAADREAIRALVDARISQLRQQ